MLPPSNKRGVALIITLAIITILAVLLLSFLISMQSDRASTYNYGRAIRAEELGVGALQEITSSLLDEMNIGSTAGTSYTVNGTRIYVPKNSLTAMPARIGFLSSDYLNPPDVDSTNSAKLPPTLIRVSRNGATYPAAGSYGVPMTNNVVLLASSIPTTSSSANGRSVTPTRWNKPLFMNASQSKAPTAFQANPPQWVYVTRSGTRLLQNTDAQSGILNADIGGKNTSAVVGRYAYVVYDEGALLDVNVAGCRDSDTNLAPAAGKSFISYADLTKITGLTNQTDVNNLIAWRNKGGLATYNSYTNLITKLSTNGFRKSYNNSQSQVSDNPLLSRQDLINYMTNVIKVDTVKSLPYLTTFSRAVDAPTWIPVTPATSTIDYAGQAETSTSINRDLANVRFSFAGPITHYYDDATAATYSAKVGDPLLQSRFSLAKLAWFNKSVSAVDPANGTDPSSTYAAAIQACFGLKWDTISTTANGGNKCWRYVGSPGSVSSSTIETLDQIAGEKREPNFFELLKAAILSGSVGLDPGPASFKNDNMGPNNSPEGNQGAIVQTGHANAYGWSFDRAGSLPAPSRIPDMQIMQIGANIIDQYDDDSYPTAIYFKYAGMTATNDAAIVDGVVDHNIYGTGDIVYGVENLPYLNKMVTADCVLDTTSATLGTMQGPYSLGWAGNTPTHSVALYSNATISSFLQPEIWNPHQVSGSIITAPATFQIRGYGITKTFWVGGTLCWTAPPPPIQPVPVPAPYTGASGYSPEVDLSTQSITFTVSTGIKNPTFQQHPIRLTQDKGLLPDLTITATSSEKLSMDWTDGKLHVPSWNGPYSTNPTNKFVAFCAGIDPAYSDCVSYQNPNTAQNGPSPVLDYARDQSSPYMLQPITFALGWLDPNGGFHPYSYIPGIFIQMYSDFQNIPMGDDAYNNSVVYGVIDPRTQRLGTFFKYNYGDYDRYDQTPFPGAQWRSVGNWGPNALASSMDGPVTANFVYTSPTGASSDVFTHDWQVNWKVPTGDPTMASATYYKDPDGVIRPGDSIYGNAQAGNGLQTITSTSSSPGPLGDSVGTLDGNSSHGRRPVILNRPFFSPGDLGYASRDLPFKTLDFFTILSADAALLDVFSVADVTQANNNQVTSITSGQLNINNAPYPVIKAILSGATKKELAASTATTTATAAYNIATESSAIASAIASRLGPATATASNSLVMNRSDLVLKLGSDPSATGSGTIHNAFTTAADQSNKAYLEAPVRALSDVVNTRTWNLMIDVVVQSGRMTPSAQTLADFVVEGERRYWLHIAIDRYTGKVIEQQLEPVYE